MGFYFGNDALCAFAVAVARCHAAHCITGRSMTGHAEVDEVRVAAARKCVARPHDGAKCARKLIEFGLAQRRSLVARPLEQNASR